VSTRHRCGSVSIVVVTTPICRNSMWYFIMLYPLVERNKIERWMLSLLSYHLDNDLTNMKVLYFINRYKQPLVTDRHCHKRVQNEIAPTWEKERSTTTHRAGSYHQPGRTFASLRSGVHHSDALHKVGPPTGSPLRLLSVVLHHLLLPSQQFSVAAGQP
jgi:hypothetical protein